MKIINTIILNLISLTVIGQSIIEGTIKSELSKESIPYVNIGIVNKNIGTVSDEKGYFRLEISNKYENDSIRISSIGFQTLSLTISDFKDYFNKNSIYYLNEAVTNLEEITVVGNKLREKILGNKTKSKLMRGGFSNSKLGNELGIKIKIKDSPTFIKSFHANVISNPSKSMKFRLNFYNLKNGLPYYKIIPQNILFDIKTEEGEFTLDLSEYEIIIEDDFFVSVELIENNGESDKGVFFSSNLLSSPVFARLTSQGKWKKYGGVSIGFNLTVLY